VKLDEAILRELLQAHGFEAMWRSGSDLGFMRPSTEPGLFEHVVIGSAGREGEAIYANVAVSIVQHRLGTKGMCELRLVDEVAGDAERGWTAMRSLEESREWARQLAGVAPHAATALAAIKGPALLARTAAARTVVESHLKQLPDIADLDALKVWLLGRLEADGEALARRLAAGPGVLQKAGAELVYEAACLAIVLFEVKNHGVAQAKLDPLGDRELMWRIQLLVDRLEARQRSADRLTAETGAR
jgi:hypothetical protein